MKESIKRTKNRVENILGRTQALFNDQVTDSDPAPSQTSNPPPASGSSQFQQRLPGTSQDGPNHISNPTPSDIIRYRYHHGTNLGSIYVLEKWLFPSQFPENASGTSELESVKAWVSQIGLDATRLKFEEHWANAVTDNDIQWLINEAKCTTIRLPIGYFDLDPAFAKNTPFAPYIPVYRSAWASIRTLVSRLRAHSIGTLIDLHALPGGANGAEHSGTNLGAAELWTIPEYRDIGVKCCEFIAKEVAGGLDGIVGVQIVNEAEWESERMYEWYDDCIDAISAIDPTIPVILSDAWNLQRAVEYSLKKNKAFPTHPTCPVVIDTHLYWAFSDDDKAKSPQQIISEVDTKLTELDGKEGSIFDRGAVQAWVGEYSCVLTEDSWAKAGATPKEELVRHFAQAQSKRWQLRSGGSFFWTWKMDWFPGGEWGFAAQTSFLHKPSTALIEQDRVPSLLERANYRRDERMYHAVNQHIAYWDHLAPNTPCEHWRYESGWKVGYNDAYTFFAGYPGVNSSNKVGNLEIWVLKRIRESGMRGQFVWEFEQGLRRGVEDFYGVVGI